MGDLASPHPIPDGQDPPEMEATSAAARPTANWGQGLTPCKARPVTLRVDKANNFFKDLLLSLPPRTALLASTPSPS